MKTTRTLLAVLEAFLAAGARRLYGYDIMTTVGIKSGTLYPILDRLETAGWIVGEWGEEIGHARRRYYTLTAEGARAARAALEPRRVPRSGAGVAEA